MQRPTPLSILVVEDNLPDFVLLEEELLLSKIEFESIRHIKRLADLPVALLLKKPDVIFLDLFLPDGSGNSTLEKVLELVPDVAIIIMSGLSDMRTALQALASGAQDYLIKGDFDHKLLAKVVLYSIERKKNQEMLRLSNERLEVISDATNDMVWEWNLQTGEMYRNEVGHQKVYGFDANSLPPKFEDWIKGVHPDDRQRLHNGFSEIFHNQSIKTYQGEFRYILPNGEVIYIHDRGSILRDSEGKVIRLVGASQNITDRKQVELKLLASEHRFKSLVQKGHDLIGIITENGEYSYVSPTTNHILGYDADHFIGRNAFEFIHPDDRQTTLQHLQKISAQPTVELPPFRFQHANGEWRWIKTKLTNLLSDPAVQGIVSTSWDITEARKLEEEMHRLSLVAKETVNGVVITDAEGAIIWVNSSFTTCTGYTLEESTGKSPGSFLQGPATSPETVAYIREQISRQLPFACEIVNYHKDGTPLWLHLQGQPLFNDKGDLVQFFAIQTDITKEKLAQQEAERHKERFSSLIQNSFDVVEIIDTEGKIKFVSPAVERIFGFRPEDLQQQSGFEYVHPDDRTAAFEKLLHILSSPASTDVLTLRLMDSQGQYHYCEVLAKNLLENPHIQGVVLNIRDVHEKVEAEQRLQLSESNYRLLFEGNPQPMWIVNRKTYAFIEVNRAALTLYGYSREEFASMTLYDIRLDNEIKKLVQWQEDHPAAIGDVYDAGEWKHRRKDGDEIIVEITVSIISYHGEEVMLVLINNVTEKKKLEKKLLEEKINRQKQITAASIRMQEKERELIGRELHDNVNQILAAAKLHIEYACSEEQLQKNILVQGKEYIMMAMSEIRKLSKALVPPSISDIGLIASINDLVDSFSVIENMQLNVSIDINETILNGVQKLTIYRVVQEQISNIIKYANATQVSIYLAANGNTVSLTIADNGVGFDKTAKKKGIGINNIKARVKTLDGKTVIDTEPGFGCRLSICFPLQTAQSGLLLEND